jgi:hypothetical protein
VVGGFRSEAAVAMHAGAAPLACSSGAWQRRRLSRVIFDLLHADLDSSWRFDSKSMTITWS